MYYAIEVTHMQWRHLAAVGWGWGTAPPRLCKFLDTRINCLTVAITSGQHQ